MSELINIFIVNHGQFGKYMIESTEMIVGKSKNLYSFSLMKDMSIEDLIFEIQSKIDEIEGDVLFLTDLFGGTPNNVATYFHEKYGYKIIAGYNLPMLIELILTRDNTDNGLSELIDLTINTGKESIKSI